MQEVSEPMSGKNTYDQFSTCNGPPLIAQIKNSPF